MPGEPRTIRELETQLVLRAGHLPSCGEGAEFPWDCTCDYAGFMEQMGRVLAAAPASSAGLDGLRAALERAAENNHSEGGHEGYGGPPTFRECSDPFCREAVAALATSTEEPRA